jgi:hypothetical protein
MRNFPTSNFPTQDERWGVQNNQEQQANQTSETKERASEPTTSETYSRTKSQNQTSEDIWEVPLDLETKG